jgi:hypothetical protein
VYVAGVTYQQLLFTESLLSNRSIGHSTLHDKLPGDDLAGSKQVTIVHNKPNDNSVTLIIY